LKKQILKEKARWVGEGGGEETTLPIEIGPLVPWRDMEKKKRVVLSGKGTTEKNFGGQIILSKEPRGNEGVRFIGMETSSQGGEELFRRGRNNKLREGGMGRKQEIRLPVCKDTQTDPFDSDGNEGDEDLLGESTHRKMRSNRAKKSPSCGKKWRKKYLRRRRLSCGGGFAPVGRVKTRGVAGRGKSQKAQEVQFENCRGGRGFVNRGHVGG